MTTLASAPPTCSQPRSEGCGMKTSMLLGLPFVVVGAAFLGGCGAAEPGESGEEVSSISDPLTWTQQTLTASDGSAGDRLGTAVALNGSTALVGAYEDNSRAGSAYVFVKGGQGWSQQAKLTAN